MKIKKIEVQNFKAISDKEIDFNGCSAIITAGNNKGKTSLLRGLVDRFRGDKPDIIVKQGEDAGLSKMELTDGSVVEWRFSDKSESFSFTTKDGIRQTAGVLSGIGERYFGRKFDIDKFLNSTPKAQVKELQALVGLDFSEIDSRYRMAYENRTQANAEVKRLRGLDIKKPEKVEKPDVESAREAFVEARNMMAERKVQIVELTEAERQLQFAIDSLDKVGLAVFLDAKGAELELNERENVIPEEINLDELEHSLQKANDQLRLYDSYERDMEAYNKWVEDGKAAKEQAEKLDKKVKDIEAEKKQMIADAKMPSEFEVTEDGILYNGLPLTNSQISSSAKYIAALKLGAMVLGEVKSLHFDASFLDKNSLAEIQKWASDSDLQLLIERPDFEGGEIKYEIIES